MNNRVWRNNIAKIPGRAQVSSEKPVEGDAQDIAADTGDYSDPPPQQDREPGIQQSSEQPAEGE